MELLMTSTLCSSCSINACSSSKFVEEISQRHPKNEQQEITVKRRRRGRKIECCQRQIIELNEGATVKIGRREENSRRRIHQKYWPLPCANLPLFLFHFLLISISILPESVISAGSRTVEIDVDWTLGRVDGLKGGTTIIDSTALPQSSGPLPNNNSQQQRPMVQTKYVRLKDALRFRCPSDLSFSIHLVSAESALLCQLPPEPKERDRAQIGFCGPKSSDPRLILRRYSPLPGKPTFQEGQSYFFISTSDGTSAGVNQASGGLCRSNGLRLRIVILPTTADGAENNRPADETTDLAKLLFPAGPAETTSTSSTTPFPAPTDPFGVFPAILTLEEGGQRRKVIVNSQQELTRQIEMANSNNQKSSSTNGENEEIIQWQQRHQQQHWNAPSEQSDRYELTDLDRWPPSHHRGNIRRKTLQDSEERPAAKSVRSPLAESQRLVYIIGYDGHEPPSSMMSSSSNSNRIFCPILFFTLFMAIIQFFLY